MNDFKETFIRHALELESQNFRIVFLISKIISKYDSEILEKIDIENSNSTQSQIKIYELVDKMYEEIKNDLLKELKNLGYYEADFQKKILNKKTELENNSGLTKEEVSSLLLAAYLGRSIYKNINIQKQNFKNNINRTLKIIYTSKTTNNQAKALFKKTVLKNNNTYNQTIAKTAAANTTNSARLKVFNKNNIKKYQYVAILDKKTSKICKSLDGKVYNVSDKKAPRPPQHYNCRSEIAPIINENYIFTEDDTFKEFSKTQKDEKKIIDENGNFKMKNSDIISLKERREKDKDLLK